MKSIMMNMRWVVWLLLGLGVLFITIGVTVGFFVQGFENETDARVFRYVFISVFAGIGAIMVLIGAAIEYGIRRNEAVKEQLISQGNFAWAEIVDIMPQYFLRVNQVPFVLRCMLRLDGQNYILKSKLLRFNPQSLLPKGKVKAWYDPSNIRKYYIDIDGSVDQGFIEI